MPRNFLLCSTAVFSPVAADRGHSQQATPRPRLHVSRPSNEGREDRRATVRRQHPTARTPASGDDEDADQDRRDEKRRRRKERRKQLQATLSVHPLRLYRPTTVCELLSIDPSTLWRWRRDGLIEQPIRVGTIIGWTNEQL